MHDWTVVETPANWDWVKAIALESISSPITKRGTVSPPDVEDLNLDNGGAARHHAAIAALTPLREWRTVWAASLPARRAAPLGPRLRNALRGERTVCVADARGSIRRPDTSWSMQSSYSNRSHLRLGTNRYFSVSIPTPSPGLFSVEKPPPRAGRGSTIGKGSRDAYVNFGSLPRPTPNFQFRTDFFGALAHSR